MCCVIFSANGPDKIEESSPWEYQGFVSAQFCIVVKYESLYKSELKRFRKYKSTPYALPVRGKAMRTYRGIDRYPWKYTPDDFHEYPQEKAIQYFNSLSARDSELIFIRAVGCDDAIPDGFSLQGYDAAWVFGFGLCDGFSAICDCMFLSRWHGCDQSGTEFLTEFQQLNHSGLFDSSKDAVNYLKHYLSQDWAEFGEYCIYEIYSKR